MNALSRPPASASRRLARLFQRGRWAIFAVWAAFAVVAGLQLSGLGFSTDYTLFFGEGDPERMAFVAMEERFTQTDNVVFIVEPQGGGDVFRPDLLTLVQELEEASHDLPFARRVDALTSHRRMQVTEDTIGAQPLVEGPAAALTDDELATLRTRAMTDPILRGGLVAQDAGATGVVVTLDLPRQSASEVRDTASAARAIAADLGARHPEATITVSGLAMMNDAFMAVSIDDLLALVPLMYLGMIVLLAFMLRSRAAVAAIVVIVGLSTLAAAALAGALGYPLTPPSASAPTIVMTLAIADCVHLYSAARVARGQGLVGWDAIGHATLDTWRPILLTSVTTLVGFLALNFAEATPFQHLGNMTAAGIAVALLASLTLFPALLGAVAIRPQEGRERATAGRVVRAAVAASRHPRVVLGITAALTAVCLGAMTQLRSNEDFVRYFAEDVPFRRDTEHMMEELTGIYALELTLDSGAPGGITEPAYLGQVSSLASWLREQPETRHVFAFSDLMRAIHQGLAEDGSEGSSGVSAEADLPESREMAAQSLLLYEMSLPAGQGIGDRVDHDRRRSRLTVTVGDLSSTEIRAFEDRVETWAAHHVGDLAVDATSPVVIFAKLTGRNTMAMLRGNLLTLGAISLFLLLLLRRRRLGLVSLVPNLVPMVVAYGLWSLFIHELGIVAAIAGSVCLGIVVDDTIHFLSRYQRERDGGASVDAALVATLEAVGPALATTSVVLGFGFSVLTLSSFQMNVHLGALTTLVIALALGADLFLLPALLRVAESVGAERSPEPLETPMSTGSHRTITLTAILLAVVASWPAGASAQRDGASLARRVAQRAAGFGDFRAQLRMELQDGNESTERRLSLKALETDEGTHSLIVFDNPSDVRGTALLSRSEDGESQQWLYLPALRRARRVASGQLSSAFLGSEFAYEDISALSPGHYRWEQKGEDGCGDGTSDRCTVLVGRPKFEGSGYTRRVLYVDADHYRIRRIEYFGRGDAHLKTLVNSDWRQHAGRFWRAHTWTMTNHQSRKRTVVRVGGYEFGNGFSDRDFSRSALGRSR